MILDQRPLVSGVLVLLLLGGGYAVWREWRPAPLPVAVLVGKWTTRRRWRRLVGDAVRRLQRLVGSPSPTRALLLVEALPEGQRATRVGVRRRDNGETVRLVLLALSIPERRLTADEVLAALAEQYLVGAGASRRRAARPATPPPVSDPLGALLADLGLAANGLPQQEP